MLVPPVPVILLVAIVELDKTGRLAVVLFGIDTISLIFLTVPCMAVVVAFILIGVSGFLICGSQNSRRQCYWDHKAGTQQGGIPKTGHDCLFSSLANRAIAGPSTYRRLRRMQRAEYKDDTKTILSAEWRVPAQDEVSDMQRMTSSDG